MFRLVAPIHGQPVVLETPATSSRSTTRPRPRWSRRNSTARGSTTDRVVGVLGLEATGTEKLLARLHLDRLPGGPRQHCAAEAVAAEAAVGFVSGRALALLQGADLEAESLTML